MRRARRRPGPARGRSGGASGPRHQPRRGQIARTRAATPTGRTSRREVVGDQVEDLDGQSGQHGEDEADRDADDQLALPGAVMPSDGENGRDDGHDDDVNGNHPEIRVEVQRRGGFMDCVPKLISGPHLRVVRDPQIERLMRVTTGSEPNAALTDGVRVDTARTRTEARRADAAERRSPEEAGGAGRPGDRPLPVPVRPDGHRRRAARAPRRARTRRPYRRDVVRMAGRVTGIRGHGKLVLRHPPGRVRVDPAAHAGLDALSEQAAAVLGQRRPGRLDRCRGRGRHQPPGRALGRRDRAVPPVQVAAPATRQVARADGHRHPLPPAGDRPAGQRRTAGGLRHPVQGHRRPAQALLAARSSSRSTPRSSSPRPAGPWPVRS